MEMAAEPWRATLGFVGNLYFRHFNMVRYCILYHARRGEAFRDLNEFDCYKRKYIAENCALGMSCTNQTY